MARRFTKDTANYLTYPPGTFNRFLAGAAQVSFGAWVNMRTSTAGSLDADDLLTIMVGSSNATGFGIRFNRATSSPGIHARARSQDAAEFFGGAYLFDPNALMVGMWRHVGAVWNFTAKTCRIYFDGVQNALVTGIAWGQNTYTPSGTPTVPDGIGSASTSSTGVPISSTRQFDGVVGEMAMWNIDIGEAGMRALFAGVPASKMRPGSSIILSHNGNGRSENITGGITASATLTGQVPSQPDASPRVKYLIPPRRWSSVFLFDALSGTVDYGPFYPTAVANAGSWTAVGAGSLLGALSDTSNTSVIRSNSGTVADPITLNFSTMPTSLTGNTTFYITYKKTTS